MELHGSRGRCFQSTLLRYEKGHECPLVGKWELDWVTADPFDAQERRLPAWARENLASGETRLAGLTQAPTHS
jgi:hypothetical protein